MSLFRQEPAEPATHCVIWMHGIGANAQDMMGLARQLRLQGPVRHLFLDAPTRPITFNNGMQMQAWYDVLGFGDNLAAREDKTGILASEEMIQRVYHQQLTEGFDSKNIFFAGFSQGGAMALFTGLRTRLPLGGILALSTYLPLANECAQALTETPIFLASGDYDFIVPPTLTEQVFEWLQAQAFSHVSFHRYPMDHSICAQEIHDISTWFNQIIVKDAA